MLSSETIARFSRQLLLPGFEAIGQKALSEASAAIVGAGGLGCPVAMYLAAVGIGRLGIVDFDIVEPSNLHRQILHTEESIGTSKASSAVKRLQSLNSSCKYDPINILLTSKNAMEILKPYDVLVDTSDNMATRYLLNDVAVLLNKPLVSGCALRWEGQLTVYHYPGDSQCPCYRCIFPIPADPSMVINCNDGGILGPVVGVIGSMQALEVIRVILGKPNFVGKMFLFDADNGRFQTIQLRKRQFNCEACGNTPKIPPLLDYAKFCQSNAVDKAASSPPILDPSDRLEPQEYAEMIKSDIDHILIDVRDKNQFCICSLPNAYNIPLNELAPDRVKELCENKSIPIIVMCRRGNASQKAVLELKSYPLMNERYIKDIKGGIEGWAKQVDSSFPIY